MLLNTNHVLAQEFTEIELKKINIPLLIINTDDGVDPQGYRIDHPEGCVGIGLTGNEYKTGRMVMTLLDSVIYDSGEYAVGASGVRIRLRGNTSTLWSKKPYKLKLSKKFDLLQRGDKKYCSKDWVLLSCPKIEPEFMDEFVKVWNGVKDTFYDDMLDYLHAFEQDYGEVLNICRELDSKRWKRGRYNLVADDVRIIDEWIHTRLEWIDEQLMKETFVDVVKEEQGNSCIYTLDGRKVSSDSEIPEAGLAAGIYIKDGQKFIVN